MSFLACSIVASTPIRIWCCVCHESLETPDLQLFDDAVTGAAPALPGDDLAFQQPTKRELQSRYHQLLTTPPCAMLYIQLGDMRGVWPETRKEQEKGPS